MFNTELLTRIDERQQHMDEKVTIILTQVKSTNGRVTKLEMWRNFLLGAWAASTIIVGAIAWIYKS